MKTTVIARLFAAAMLLLAGGAYAHHSFTAEFDGDKPKSLTGIVTKVEWTNPHVWIYMNVKDAETGKVTNWGAELGPPHGLQRSGWRRDTLQIGTEISVAGFLARNGSDRVNARTVTVTGTGGRPGAILDADSSINNATGGGNGN